MLFFFFFKRSISIVNRNINFQNSTGSLLSGHFFLNYISFLSGALQLLGDFIDDVEERTQIAVLCAIRNLSDAATNETNIAPLIIRLLNVIAMGDESLAACATGILSNLTCNNVRNKQTVCVNR